MALNPSSLSKVVVRATNWLGDAVMSLPAIRAIREALPRAHIAVVAKPWVADLYGRETSVDRVIRYDTGQVSRREFAARLREERFDGAILLQNAFDAALMAWLAHIPVRIGYNRDGRGLLLTHAIPVPEPGDIPRHERFYYLELLRRAGLMERFPECGAIRMAGIEEARECGAQRLAAMGVEGPVIGISPGAAYGNAKRWLPERFAEAVERACGPAASVLIFGSGAERALCQEVADRLPGARNLAGETSLSEFIDLAAQCRLFVTNDSGAMHVTSALGVPTVAVFGATDDVTTGPTGPLARVVRDHAECSPCLLRECPIDHRCMTRVTADAVAAAARELLGMDTRSKILTVAAARRLRQPVAIASGYFDILRAEHVRELAEFKNSAGAALLAVVLPLENGFLEQRARAELAAALSVIDYVVEADGSDVDSLMESLQPASLARFEAADARRRGQLMEHVHSR